MPSSAEARLESWVGVWGVSGYVKVWRVALACRMWCVWVEHNRHPFEGKEVSLRNLKFLFLKTLQLVITM